MLLWSVTLPACERAWLTSDENYSPLSLNVRHCLAVLYLFACTLCESASPVGSPKLHLTGDTAHAGPQVGGARWGVWRQVQGTQLWGGGGRRRLTDLPWAVACASGKDRPSNHLQETGVWEDNYKYSCQRRHVSIDALDWDQQRCKEASGRDGKTGETWEVGLQRAIN